MRMVALLTALAAILLGCTSTTTTQSAIEKNWVGKPEALLIVDLGPPTRETTDGKGGHILIWEFKRWKPIVHDYVSEWQAWVGPDGAIYRTFWKDS